MATNKVPESFTYAAEADADLRTKLNYFCKISADGEIALAGANEKVFGTIIEVNLQGSVPYGPVTAQFAGIAKVVAGAAVAAGGEVSSDASGKAVTGGTNKVGVALTAASADGDVIDVAIIGGAT
jgi:hypothetical protein